MGHRANYAIRENGQVALYYSHWGALTVAEDVFLGPATTEAFIQGNDATTEWLDNIWAEGGIVLNKEKRRATYYHYQWPDEKDLRRVYETLLARTWSASGWTVERAQEWGDVASAAGVDRKLVTAEPSRPRCIAIEDLGKNLEKASPCYAILSVKCGTEWKDYAIDVCLPGLLMNGPELLDRLAAVAGLEQLRSSFAQRKSDSVQTAGDFLDEFCAIDIELRTLRVSLPEDEEEWCPFLMEQWPGWTVASEPGGAAAHFLHTGRAVPADLLQSPKPPAAEPPNRSFEECVQLIRAHIAKNEQRKSADIAKFVGIVEEMNQRDGPVTVAPGFLRRTPSSRPRLLDRVRNAWRLMLMSRQR